MRPMKLAAAALALLFLCLPLTAAASGDFDTNPYDNDAVAMKGDMTLGRSDIATDDAQGNVEVRLHLLYKGSDIFTDANLSFFDLSPIVDDLEKYPFEVTWGSYRLTAGDQKRDALYSPSPSQAGQVSRTYFPFQFKTKKDVINGTYPIKFKVRFLHAGQNPAKVAVVEDTLEVFVRITHGKDPETPTPTPTPTPVVDATPKPQARVIMKQYIMDPADVIGGDSFDLTMVLENTHTSMEVRNMKCSIAEAKGTVLPESGSSSFFIQSIGPGKTYEVKLRMQALPSAGIEPVKMTLTMNYDDKNDKHTETEEFTLPIHQVIKLKVDDPICPSESYVDAPFNLMLNIYNVGKASMFNTMITLESDTLEADENMFAGTLAAGAQATFDVMVTAPSAKLMNGTPGEDLDPSQILPDDAPTGDVPEGEGAQGEPLPASTPIGAVLTGRTASMAIAMPIGGGSSGGGGGGVGTMLAQGNIVITYEDDFGTVFRKEVPISVSILSYDQAYGNDMGMMQYDYDYERQLLVDRATGQYYDPMTMEPVELGVNPFIYIGIGAGALVVIIIALIVVLRMRKKRRLAKEQALELQHDVEALEGEDHEVE